MKFLKELLEKIKRLVKSGAVQDELDKVVALVPKAMPVIDLVASVVTTMTPTKVDDLALAFLHSNYPQLFDGSLKTGEDVKLYMFSAAAAVLKNKYGVSTSVARAAVQMAYVGKKSSEEKN